MDTRISEKIELFKNGFISDENILINYDQELLDDCYALLDSYWSADLQYYVKHFMTDEDYLNEKNKTDTFPISGEDFTTTGISFDITDLETATGIDFITDLDMPLSAYEEISGNIDAFSSGLIVELDTILYPITSEMIDIQKNANLEIYKQEETKSSIGVTALMKIINNFLDENDVNILYTDAYKKSLESINTQPVFFSNADILNLITSKIIKSSKILFGEKLKFCLRNNLLYCKLQDETLEKELFNLVYKFYPDNDDSIRIIRAANSLMPDDQTIMDETTQNDLITAAMSLILDIDIYIRVIKKKGYM
jgi:hypothetical protein